MGELFTFIQGRGYHKILYQGINKELVPQADKHSDFLNGIALAFTELNYKKFLPSLSVEQIRRVKLEKAT
ncbi:hypothetical protein TTHERM_02442130 (macronuclear) [Tetrahymena thermophila SB210]|uniref:Uncharacterized protein n=1 Tax=Tetrahymena thermophila (strain SB210) TaxID=312017 RepID=Q224M3_TETTS|nr:hypothetical protein TTHERM_02442130 [Tetrahymena thermophila SB210]EAR80739.2 hypothetical protein TTHERM_02442130 [Tetrahymena thermophila SB210]|eukprot:XP_001028402.2 hypothetical protein TTHERM_02442130 [Tetrahymena thermophila SB210]